MDKSETAIAIRTQARVQVERKSLRDLTRDAGAVATEDAADGPETANGEQRVPVASFSSVI